jgi:hypothetical protein
MEEEFRGNFIEEMRQKIETYKNLKEKCKLSCIDDCNNKLKLETNDKPSFFTWDRNTQKQEIKKTKCAELFKNSSVDKCIEAITSTPNTKVACNNVLALEKKIQSLFAMYEQQYKDVEREEWKLKNGMIDITFQQEGSQTFVKSVPRSDYVIDVKNKCVGDGNKYDLTYNDTRLEDDKTLGNYSIMNGYTLLITPKPTGGARKRRTVRKNKIRRV